MTVSEYLECKDKEKIAEYNKELVAKYPWILPPDKYDPLLTHPPDAINPFYDYSWTMLDDMPYGWRIAFGENFCNEIQSVYETLSDVVKKDFYVVQIKEKFGYLRCYMSLTVDAVSDIIEKYEEISGFICVNCGKPAKYMTTGWICPYCENCIKNCNDKYVPIKEFYKENDDEQKSI